MEMNLMTENAFVFVFSFVRLFVFSGKPSRDTCPGNVPPMADGQTYFIP